MGNVRSIVDDWLVEHGYDGLWGDDCACEVGDLFPCLEDGVASCDPGYKVPCDCGEHDFHISACRPSDEAVVGATNDSDLSFGDDVWIRRGGGPSDDPYPGCSRSVPGRFIKMDGNNAYCILIVDDPWDTVGWKKAGDIGNWSRSAISKRASPSEQ